MRTDCRTCPLPRLCAGGVGVALGPYRSVSTPMAKPPPTTLSTRTVAEARPPGTDHRAARTVPQLGVGLFSGVLADWYNRAAAEDGELRGLVDMLISLLKKGREISFDPCPIEISTAVYRIWAKTVDRRLRASRSDERGTANQESCPEDRFLSFQRAMLLSAAAKHQRRSLYGTPPRPYAVHSSLLLNKAT